MAIPSGYTPLDFVGFTDRGTYAGNVPYVRNDLVHHGGNIWLVLIDGTLGIVPSESANYTLWLGEPTNLVERIIAPLEDNPATVAYGVGRQIIFNDWLYEVIAPIAVGDALVTYESDPSNANIKLALPVETQVLAIKAEADATDAMIAPNENGSTMSQSYAIGAQFIRGNVLYKAKAAITSGTAWSSLTLNTDYEVQSDSLVEQINTKQPKTLATPITVNNVQQTTVEGALGAINTDLGSTKQALSTTNNVLGAKNLLPNNGTTQSNNNVTYTVNSDGSITANVNAAITTNSWFTIAEIYLDAGDYVLSGCPSGGSESAYKLAINFNDSSAQYPEIGSGYEFTLSSKTKCLVRIKYASGYSTLGSKTFYPMIRPKGTDSIYVPYVMTNRELMDNKADKQDLTNQIWTNNIAEVTSTSKVALTKANGDLISSSSGVYLITLQTLTGVSDCASQYVTRGTAITTIYEGVHANAPRLTIENDRLMVSTNTVTTPYGVKALIQAMQ